MIEAAAWDTHIHVYDPAAPLAPTAPNRPPAHAAIADYVALRGGEAARAVVVQPSHYGLDNAVTLAAAAALGGRAVVVVGPDTTAAMLRDLHQAGAIGARFHMARSPAVTWADLPGVAAMIAPLGWSLHLQARGHEIASRAALLAALPCPLVIEHFGRPDDPADPADAGATATLGLLQAGRTYVKLSAGYDFSPGNDPADAAVAALARRYAAAAPDRVLWGSNWPHPNRTTPAPPDAAIFAAPGQWFRDDKPMLRRLLRDNPAALFAAADAARP